MAGLPGDTMNAMAESKPRPARAGDAERGREAARTQPTGRTRDEDANDAALRVLRDKLGGVLRRLPEIERRVVELRMGLVDGNPHKPGEVASKLGLTIPEVRKIEERAFSRIREVGPIRGLERFLGR